MAQAGQDAGAGGAAGLSSWVEFRSSLPGMGMGTAAMGCPHTLEQLSTNIMKQQLFY